MDVLPLSFREIHHFTVARWVKRIKLKPLLWIEKQEQCEFWEDLSIDDGMDVRDRRSMCHLNGLTSFRVILITYFQVSHPISLIIAISHSSANFLSLLSWSGHYFPGFFCSHDSLYLRALQRNISTARAAGNSTVYKVSKC